MIMKRLIATIALALLVVPATFAGEQSFLERVAVYLAPPSIGAYEFDGPTHRPESNGNVAFVGLQRIGF